MFHSVHTSSTSWIFFFIEHIVSFVSDGLSPIGFTTYRQGVKSHCLGNGVKRWIALQARAPLHGCACTGVCAPAHTR